ncbi:hypothetical protein ACFQ1I_07580 [Kitasatospora arboriphila]
MQVLGLTGPRPVTFELGTAIVDADAHGCGDDEPGSPVGRVFVTPELDGWTLVAGAWCDPCDPELGEQVRGQVVELSARYGRAQAYYFGAQNDGSAWLVAENGSVVRRYKEAANPTTGCGPSASHWSASVPGAPNSGCPSRGTTPSGRTWTTPRTSGGGRRSASHPRWPRP